MSFLLVLPLLAAAPAATSDVDARGIRTAQQALEALAKASEGNPKGGTPPIPRGNPGDWIRADDFPPSAAADNETGRVSFEAEVDPGGRVSRCTVTVSSGSNSLDQATCNLVTQRAIFQPALDKRGKPTTGVYRNRVVWMASHLGPAPRAHRVVLTFILEENGSTSECRIEGSDLTPAQQEAGLAACRKTRYEPYVGLDGNPVRRLVRMSRAAEVEPVAAKSQ